MTARNLLREDESFPTARALRFAGGVVELAGMPESHPGSITPTTYVEPSREARAIAFLELARTSLSEAQLAGQSARIFLIMSAQSCVDSALGLLR